MKLNRFIFWQLKKWLPIILVFFLFFSAYMWLSAVSKNYSYYTPNLSYSPYRTFSTGIGDISTIIIIISFIMPFFVFSYKYGKNSADTYNSLPFRYFLDPSVDKIFPESGNQNGGTRVLVNKIKLI